MMERVEGHAMFNTPREQWRAAKSRLREALRALDEEVRSYPTPIARCDDQLPGLIERRTAIRRELEQADALREDELSDSECLSLVGQVAARHADLFSTSRTSAQNEG